jgi:ABC-type polysaccharide/polyol phosphate transport system ATPase subunit
MTETNGTRAKMSGDAVRIAGLGVRFSLHYEKSRGGDAAGLFKRRGRRELWALRGIDLSIGRGEIFGIIGANGAGKSTLLKVLAGIFPPTEGTMEVNGTLAPFIELGAAFNPELTGAENIYLTGSVHCVPRREIRANFDRIVEFAELRDFIDTPVKNYSSGMFVRLAFSSILFFKPDILLVDEVFSVGDEAFQQKSFEKVVSFKNDGATVILVSHDSALVERICDRALVLDQGKMSFLGPAPKAVEHYHDLLMGGKGSIAPLAEKAASPAAAASPEAAGTKAADPRRWGDGDVRIVSVKFFGADGRERTEFRTGEPFEARLAYESKPGIPPPVFGVSFATIYRLLIHGPNTLSAPVTGEFKPAGAIRFLVPKLPLLPGDYLFSAACYDRSLQNAHDHHEQMYHFRVTGSGEGGRGGREFGCVKIDSRWEFGAP